MQETLTGQDDMTIISWCDLHKQNPIKILEDNYSNQMIVFINWHFQNAQITHKRLREFLHIAFVSYKKCIIA